MLPLFHASEDFLAKVASGPFDLPRRHILQWFAANPTDLDDVVKSFDMFQIESEKRALGSQAERIDHDPVDDCNPCRTLKKDSATLKA